MSIKTGQLAPSFKAKSYTGETIDLEQYRGKKVWLGFYRWASCPLCNHRIHEVLQRYREFEEADIQLVAVFQSPADNIAKYVGKQNPPFPLIADPDLELYGTYGVHANIWGMFYPRVMVKAFQAILAGYFSLKIDGPKAMVPADFLLDPEGLVWKAHYGKAITDHIDMDEIKAFQEDQCLDMPEAAPN